MKDRYFIEGMMEKGREAGEKVKNAFTGLSLKQLNWKPAPGAWSIGQCLDHLVVSDCLYFPALKKTTEGKYNMNFWENWSPFSGLFGRMLVNQVQEKQVKKIKTPKLFEPSGRTINGGILELFQKHLDTLLSYTAACGHLDIDKMHITSPVSRVVTFSLRRALLILMEHEHRHINQAIKIKDAKDFPPL